MDSGWGKRLQEAEASEDIHGTDHYSMQAICSVVQQTEAANGVSIILRHPVTVDQMRSLVDHLRSWHP